MESVLLFSGLIVGACVMAAGAAYSLRTVSPPMAPERPVLNLAARIVCPITGGVKRVRIGVDAPRALPIIDWCDRFGTGPVICDQRCLTALPAA